MVECGVLSLFTVENPAIVTLLSLHKIAQLSKYSINECKDNGTLESPS